jgi:type IV secretory pathway TrbD component
LFNHLNRLLGAKMVVDFNEAVVTKYQNDRLAEKAAPKTINEEVGFLLRILGEPGDLNRVFKSLHKPLTYLGVERTLFYFVCVGAVGAFNIFNSIIAGIAVFVGGFAFGHWATNSDPAFLRILAKSEKYKPRYDAAKQKIPRVEVR